MVMHTHIKKIAGFKISSKENDPTIRPIWQFVEVINDKEGDMKRHIDWFIMVQNITNLTIGDGLLVNYSFIKCIATQKRRDVKGILMDIPKGRKTKNKKWVWLVFKTLNSKFYFILWIQNFVLWMNGYKYALMCVFERERERERYFILFCKLFYYYNWNGFNILSNCCLIK